MLAGLPPVYGLYANLLGPVVYSALGSVRHGVFGPVALTCIVARLSGLFLFLLFFVVFYFVSLFQIINNRI